MWYPFQVSVSDRDTRSNIYAGMWQPNPVTVSERNTQSIQQATITITMYILIVIQSSHDSWHSIIQLSSFTICVINNATFEYIHAS